MIALVMIFTWTELADRVRTGDVAVDLARPVDLQLAWLAQDLGRAGWALLSRGILPIVFGAAVYGIYVPSDVTAIAAASRCPCCWPSWCPSPAGSSST